MYVRQPPSLPPALPVVAVGSFSCRYPPPPPTLQQAPRPLRVHFERGQLAEDDKVGQILFKKTVGVPRSYSAWQRRYFVLGGAVAKAHVLQVYVSKQVGDGADDASRLFGGGGSCFFACWEIEQPSGRMLCVFASQGDWKKGVAPPKSLYLPGIAFFFCDLTSVCLVLLIPQGGGVLASR